MGIIDKEAKYLANTYARFPVHFVSGKGSTLTGNDGKEYIDFSSGIGVNSLGHANEQFVKALEKQLGTLMHTSNLFYSSPCVELGEKLIEVSDGLFEKAFFGNSGAEANEGMIKTARKYSFDKYGAGRSNIITLTDSFHGRTITTLAATGQDHFHKYFHPFTDGFIHVKPGDMDGIKGAEGVCAVLMEAVQGEGGVMPLDAGFVKQVAEYCEANDILLLFDDIQTGMGRTGKLFGFQHFGVQPDMISLAKGLGGGVPIGAFLMNGKTASVLQPSDHGTTFGGNAFCCAAGCIVMDAITAPGFLDDVARKGDEIMTKLKAVKSTKIKDVRGKGMMIGIGLDDSVQAKQFATDMLAAGLVVLTAGGNTVRLLPPLNISDDELSKGLEILTEGLEKL